jgi:hypothetical protein
MPSPDNSHVSSDPEVMAARGQVELAKADLETQLHRAGETGRITLDRMAQKARPVLVVAAVVVGVVFVTRIVGARRRRSAWTRAFEGPPSKPSWLGATAAGVLKGVLRVMAARLTEQAAARLLLAGEERAAEEAELGR